MPGIPIHKLHSRELPDWFIWGYTGNDKNAPRDWLCEEKVWGEEFGEDRW